MQKTSLLFGTLCLFSTFACLALAGTPAEWQTRTIYQIMTDRFALTTPNSTSCSNLNNWCGGTFQGVIDNLDYITGMGFDAIWISPVPLQAQGGYHGYWQQDIYEIDPHFGTSQDLQALVTACHNAGVWVMLDVVVNHVGCPECWGCTTCNGNFSAIVPFNDSSYYHPLCEISDWSNATQVLVCRLANLPDLDQTNSFVAETFLNWINGMVKNYNFDGLRIDTVPEVYTYFWSEYQASAGVYAVGEVFNGDVGYVASFQPYLDGILSYPQYFVLISVYAQQQSMNNLQTLIQEYQSSGLNLPLLGTFIDNQDNPRFLSYTGDYQLYKSAITYALTSLGIPIIYYGTEQGFNGGADPANRESLWPYYNTNAVLYQFITLINQFRQSAQFMTQPQVQRYSTYNFYAFTRGDVFVATSNEGTGGYLNYPITYQPYADGTTICNLFYPTTDCITVQNGQFQVYLNSGESKIYYPQNQLYALGLNFTLIESLQESTEAWIKQYQLQL